jgi:ketosteroid isomerase-like protein
MILLAACGEGKRADAPAAAKPVEVAAPTPPAPTPRPEAGAAQLVDRWVAAQNAGDFEAYIALYADDFTGVRRSADDQPRRFDRAGWAADRKKMFAKGKMEVAVEDRKLEPGADDTFRFTFVQRYRRGTFEDHGEKALTVSVAGGVPRIVHEEMLWARPGWEDSARDAVDASAMRSPIAVRLEVVPPADVDADCVHTGVLLHLEDAAGTTMRTEIGTVVASGPTDPMVPPSRSKKRLYQLGGGYCAGFGNELVVKQTGDRIEVVETWSDEESGTGTDTYIAAMLPAGAELVAK